jgi:mono/diheme cytochrome c family protein
MNDDERGKMLYERHCVQCHGVAAAGDGAATDALVATVPDTRNRLDKADLEKNVRLVLDGQAAMPGFEASFDKYDARRILRYMDTIGRTPDAPVAPAEPAAPKDTGKAGRAEGEDG